MASKTELPDKDVVHTWQNNVQEIMVVAKFKIDKKGIDSVLTDIRARGEKI